MGNSLSYGIGEIERKFPAAEGVLITLLDQPLITSAYYKKMLDSYKSGMKQILASRSVSGWIGVPAIFDKYYFKDLSMLKNDEGAKKIILQHENIVTLMDAGKEEAGDMLEDIDTPESYQQLLGKYIQHT
jgi:molybdenum cofactor cytidylyltransferase